MATGTFYPAAATDTGYAVPATGEWYPEGYGSAYLTAGLYGSTQWTRVWLRFPSVSIPAGATISSATLRLYGAGLSGAAVCNLAVAGELADAPVAPSSLADLAARSFSDAVSWSGLPAVVDLTSYDSPDIASVIQTLVSRPGWTSGGPLLLLLSNNGSAANGYRNFRAFGTGPAELVVEWADAVDPTDYEVSSAASLTITAFGPEIFAGQNKVYEWEADQTLPFGPFTWKSKLVLLPAMTNFTAARVEADFSADQAAYFAALAERQAILARNAARISAGGIGGEIAEAPIGTYTLGGDSLEAVPDVGAYSGAAFLVLKVYADGVLKQTVGVFSSKPFRLKGGYRSKQYSFQIEGNIAVKKVEIATSIGDLVEA